MRKYMAFCKRLVLRLWEDQVFERANGLTYRVLLAFFPFLVFLMSMAGTLNLDESAVLAVLARALPNDVFSLVQRYLQDLAAAHSRGLASVSLFFVLYNTAGGFRAIIRSINIAYDCTDYRGPFRQMVLSVALMLTFALSIIIMLLVLIFGGQLWNLLRPFFPASFERVYTWLSTGLSLAALTLATTLIYKWACAKKLALHQVFPGAGLTVLLWVAASKVFGLFVAYFSNFPSLYGSIAGVFVLILWLNVISLILLLGNEVNALLVNKNPCPAAGISKNRTVG